MKLFRPLALSASILVLGAAGVAVAQPPAGMMAGVRDEAGGMRGIGHEHMDPAQMAQRHADHLRAALQLTPAQEPALAAFLAAMKPPEGAREEMRSEHEHMAAMTTPQRLDAMRAGMDEHRARMDQHITAVKRFYAQLTPAQQKAFDALPMGHMGHGGMGGHHMGHGQHG